MKKPSIKTKKEVWKRWKGLCAFCGIDLITEEHHIVPIKNDNSLVNDPNNLILLCSNHHRLTKKTKPNKVPSISFTDIKDLKKSRYALANKEGFYFKIPQNFEIHLGSNMFFECPYIVIVNNKPLIEMWPQKPVYYIDEVKFYLYMRFFDEDNNFIGGMFSNYWASVNDEEWNLEIQENTIEVKHVNRNIFVKFDRTNVLNITGRFYFDGIKIEAKEDELIISDKVTMSGCSFFKKEVAFNISGNKDSASIGIGGNIPWSEIAII